jgi:hypothetical protein
MGDMRNAYRIKNRIAERTHNLGAADVDGRTILENVKELG